MVYTVTLSPSIDYIVDVENFQLGRTNRTTGEIMYAGGKGINVSMVLQNLGIPSVALGYLAGFTGAQIEAMLTAQHIKTDFITLTEGQSRINLKLRSVDGTEINGLGPVISPEALERLMLRLDQLQDGDMLVLAGSIPQGVSKTIYVDIMARLAGKQVCVAVDTSGEMLRSVLPQHPFIVKPNHHELSELVGIDIITPEDALKYGEILLEQGAQNAIVSMGKDGAVFLGGGGQRLHLPAPKGELVNSVGAGDSMLAGFLAGCLAGGEDGAMGELAHAFQMAICTGSASAFSAQLATKKQVAKLMKQYKRS